MMDTQRYSRQIALPEIGEAGQVRLLEASVLCVGAGGLGSPALLYLAAAGVGRLGVADFDVVDASNLQRQILFSNAQVGEPKSAAAAVRLRALNPDIVIEEYPEGLHAENAEALMNEYDIVIDGTDNFAAKFLINDACVKFGTPLVYAALSQFEGQVSVFDGGACYRCLYPSAPTQTVKNCAEAGVIGAVAGMIGVTQAAQAIMMLVPHESFSPLVNMLWAIDVRTMRTNLLEISKDPECPVCSHPQEDIVLTYTAPTCASSGGSEISSRDILDWKAAPLPEHAVLIDVREDYEWDAGHIDGAVHFALSRLMDGESPDLKTDIAVALYCKAGVRSLQAAHILQQRGYKNLTNLTGGYDAWIYG